MLVTLHNLATTYRCLPSEALTRATTFDLYVLDVSTKHSKYQQDVAEGRQAKTNLSQKELLAMVKRVKKEE